MTNLIGRGAVVTGGFSGMGFAIATALAKAGATQDEMKAIAEPNPESAELCPIFAKLYAAALSLQGEPGRHVKATLLYEIARN